MLLESLEGVKRQNMPPLFRPKNKLSDDYHITGFISSGTYGRVFKAVKLKEDSTTVAIKRYVLFILAIYTPN